MSDNSLDEVYLEHKSGFNTLIGCEAASANGGSPENAFSGYIYTFKLNQTSLYSTADVEDDYQESGCTGSCSICPISSQNVCLWEVGSAQYELSDGTAQSCNGCGSTGCQRQEDCNLCFDRLCSTCTNFDQTDALGADSCTACITNASFQGTTPDTCACNNYYHFDEDTDTCVGCDPLCAVCTAGDNKSCSEC